MIIEAAGLGNFMKGKGVMESEIHIRMISGKREKVRKNCLGGKVYRSLETSRRLWEMYRTGG